MNRDPITKEPGSHPVGTGVGSAGGAAVGAAVGAIGGPIGMLIGGAIGAIAGGAAGHTAGEAIDPTGETEYWKGQHKGNDFNDYRPAYQYGWESRTNHRGRQWDTGLENELREGWEKAKGKSQLTWDKAKTATRNAWDRTERTFNTYQKTDSTWRDQSKTKDYFDKNMDYDRDYRPAYRYGAYLRNQNPQKAWDSTSENDFGKTWDRVKGDSRLTWDKAKNATKDAWHSVERALPGDADRDGR